MLKVQGVSHLEGGRFCSWSGGKDSCLAFHRSDAEGVRPSVIVTMLAEDGRRSRSHGLSIQALNAQASSLGARLITRATSWDGYERNFLDVVESLRDEGFTAGVFGDIDLEGHREWVRKVCSRAGIDAVLPLWNSSRRDLICELISSGYSAIIVSVKDSALKREFLGRVIDWKVIEEFEKLGIDVSGEGGEYHTFVTEGPVFWKRVNVRFGGINCHDGYSFLETTPGN